MTGMPGKHTSLKGSLLLGSMILLMGLPAKHMASLIPRESPVGDIRQTPVYAEIIGVPSLEGIYELPEGSTAVSFLNALGVEGWSYSTSEGRLDQPLERYSVLLLEAAREGCLVEVASMAPGRVFLLGGRLDVNRAEVWDLMLLPGVGPVLAKRIVEYRKTNGPFRSPQGLVGVSGISTRTVKKLEPMISTGVIVPRVE
jgi:competence protein ComEA